MGKTYDIIFEDEYLFVVNKIARIVVQPTPKKEAKTLTSLLQKDLAQKVYMCHRLDKETQGLMLYAKSIKIQKDISGQFKRHLIIKKYLALSKGNFKKKKGRFNSVILDREGRRFKERPKKAETFYRVIKRCKGFDLLEVTPKTGRTNQIRIHLAESGHPILGEKKYAFRRDFVIKSNKLTLCAYFLSFRHPVSREKIELKIGIPEYISEFVKKGG